tara:strand:- start:607 stop:1212 length:606 start_codon:yes stop_codon:yes gene_type:complete
MDNITELDNLIKLISKLPGLGPKSAKRIILRLINNREELMRPMAKALTDVYKNISRCKICGTLKPNSIECSYTRCKIVEKKHDKICIVENIADQWSIENSNIYKGYFHILGGTLTSSAENRSEDLLISSLINRIKNDSIEEIIIATSATIEGQTTAFYIKDSLKDFNIKISKLAQGLPVGGEIENLDDGTLFSAFKNRNEM